MQNDTASDFRAWLVRKCRERGLSLRKASIKAGLSTATIAALVGGVHPRPETIKKLARFFSGDGASIAEVMALEDHILVLAGYRSPAPEAKYSEALGRVVAKLRGCEEREILLVEHFIDFLNDKMRE